VDQLWRLESLSCPAHQQGDVRALAATVGVELVEDQESQPGGGLDKLLVGEAGEQQLEHHVVGEQDVWRLGLDLFAPLRAVLAGIAREADGAAAAGKAVVEELLELLQLAVGEGIHRIDDDAVDAPGRCAAKHRVDDRYDVGEALAGAGAGGDDVVAALAGGANRRGLMAMQPQWGTRIGRMFLTAEDPAALVIQNAVANEVVDPAAGLERRVERKVGLGPQQPGIERRLDHGADVGGTDRLEAADELAIAADQPLPELERVHEQSLAEVEQVRRDRVDLRSEELTPADPGGGVRTARL
jgi:hypothetical protein